MCIKDASSCQELKGKIKNNTERDKLQTEASGGDYCNGSRGWGGGNKAGRFHVTGWLKDRKSLSKCSSPHIGRGLKEVYCLGDRSGLKSYWTGYSSWRFSVLPQHQLPLNSSTDSPSLPFSFALSNLHTATSDLFKTQIWSNHSPAKTLHWFLSLTCANILT